MESETSGQGNVRDEGGGTTEKDIVNASLMQKKFPKRHVRRTEIRGERFKAVLAKINEMLLADGAIIVLLGARGTGKTQLATEAARRIVARTRHRVVYTTAVDMFARFRDGYRSSSYDENETKNIAYYAAPSVLVIDEYQERSGSEWEDRLVTRIVDARYGDMRDTIIIANADRKQFDVMAGASIVSRINETGGIITCAWPSYREGGSMT